MKDANYRDHCVWVCGSVCPLAYLKDHVSKHHEIFCTCFMWPWLGLPLTTIHYVLPDSWMTSYFHIMGQIQLQAWNLWCYLFNITHQVTVLNCRLKSATADCLVIVVIARTTALHTKMCGLLLQTEYRGLSVSLSLCLSVCHRNEPFKNGWTDWDTVWVEDLGGPKESCIRWVSRFPPWEATILRGGERVAHCKV